MVALGQNGTQRGFVPLFFFPETILYPALDFENFNLGIPNPKLKILQKELENNGLFCCIISLLTLVSFGFCSRLDPVLKISIPPKLEHRENSYAFLCHLSM